MNDVPLWVWVAFGAVLLLLLAIDLVVHRAHHGDHPETQRSAIFWTVVWIGAGLGFNVFIWALFGARAAEEYLAAYFIEKSLSLDNLFVFLVIFRSLCVPKDNQRTVLSWGIFGALVFRAVFVFLGVAALERYDWVAYVFAALLLWAAIRTLREDPTEVKESRLVAWLARHLPVSCTVHGHRFFTRVEGRLLGTPLLVAVCAVELTDILFAIDSVPVALAVTRNRFIVYSSNAFAILGLRALSIVLERSLAEMEYLHYGLAAVLGLAAVKLAIGEWVHVPPLLSVGIIVLCIGAAVWASLRARRRRAGDEVAAGGAHAPAR